MFLPRAQLHCALRSPSLIQHDRKRRRIAERILRRLDSFALSPTLRRPQAPVRRERGPLRRGRLWQVGRYGEECWDGFSFGVSIFELGVGVVGCADHLERLWGRRGCQDILVQRSDVSSQYMRSRQTRSPSSKRRRSKLCHDDFGYWIGVRGIAWWLGFRADWSSASSCLRTAIFAFCIAS